MKLPTVRKRRTWVFVVLIFSVVVCGGILGAVYLGRTKPPTSQSSNSTAKSPQNQSQPPQPDLIKLANGVSVAPASGDYNADDHLWKLLNKTHGFTDASYQPADLAIAPVAAQPGRGSDERSMRTITFNDLKQLFSAAAQHGHQLQIGSGYRSYATQAALFSRYSQEFGEEKAAAFSSRPGYSEHQSGLAVDIGTSDNACWLDTCFGETAAGKWLADHAAEYGFILRYPEGKEAVTGFQYEPWHFRYVGRDLASALQKSGQTLDEAWPILRKYQQAKENSE